jgi:ribosomal protein S18 acetylase RimI-like enzyme
MVNRSSPVSIEITIEPAVEADLPLIKLLLTELIEAVTDTEGFDVDRSIANFRTLIKDPAQNILVARQGNSLLGFVNFTIRKTMMHPGPSGLIDELVVSESNRGTRIGKQLIQAVIDKCRESGCCEVEVSTEKSNTKARRFYKACGFEEDAVLLELGLIGPNHR